MIDAQDPIGLHDRWRDNIRPVQKAHIRFYQISGAIGVFVLIAFLAFKLVPGERDDFILNAVTEGLGILATVLVLGSFNVWFSERQRKRELIVQMSSQSNDFALMAVKLLRVNGWLTDGTLQEADLSGTNLQSAYLRYAQLQGADLYQADLRKADLNHAKLQGADLNNAKMQSAKLRYAQLQDADLAETQLQGAVLENTQLQGAFLVQTQLQNTKLMYVSLENASLAFADLQGASLVQTQLQGANLMGSNLQNAKLYAGKFSESTILPDGTNWHRGVDMTRFTDPNHPDFFEPEWVQDEREWKKQHEQDA